MTDNNGTAGDAGYGVEAEPTPAFDNASDMLAWVNRQC